MSDPTQARLGLWSGMRLPPNADRSPHRTHDPIPSFIRRSQSESAAFATTLSRVSTRMKPFVMLPLPYTTTICCNPEGTGTARVFAFEPEEIPCSVMVRVLPSSVLYGGRASNSSGTATKAFSSVSYTHLRAHET